jgi:hypothetical protein
MMSIAISETAAYILKNSPSFRFRDTDEDTFAKMAKSAILTPRGADGRFLTRSPIDFFLSSGGKGNALMRPGSVIRDWGIKKDKFGSGRPVVVIDEDFPGVPIEVVADIFEGHARVMHRLEADDRRIGPGLSRLSQFPATPVSVANEGVDSPESLESIERMLEMHSTYRYKVLKWLDRQLELTARTLTGFDINKGRVSASVRKSQHTGYLIEGVSVIEITASRNIRRPEVAIALDFQTSLNEKGFQTLLCSCSLREMLLYVAGDPPNIGNRSIRLAGSDSGQPVMAAPPHSKNVLSPLSLFIPPPPPKTSSTTRGMFSHDLLGLGYSIAPIHNDEFDPFYDAHPLVVSYNIGKHTKIISSFLRSAGLANRGSIPEEASISEADDPKLLSAYLKHRARTPRLVESLPEDEPDITFTVPYGKEVVVNASRNNSTMAGFTDNSIRQGMPQLRQIEALIQEDDGRELMLYGTLSALATADPNLPSKLLSFESDDWDDVVFHIEGIVGDNNPRKQLERVSFFLSDNVMPVRYARGSILPIYEGEVINGRAEKLGFIDGDRKSYFIKKHRVRATILAMKASGKRFSNGEVGPVLLGVMSKEKRPETWTDLEGNVVRTTKRWTTIYNSIGVVGTMKGFTVEDRRALYDHIVEHSTHEDNGYLFVDPLKADIILVAEFTESRIIQAPRYAREVQMVKNKERFLTDAQKEVSMTDHSEYTDKESGRPQPVLPVAQGANIAGRSRPDYVMSDYSRLTEIDQRPTPQVSNAKIVGIRSRVKGLAFKVDVKESLTAKTEYETDEGLVFSTNIDLTQFKTNGSEPNLNPSGDYSRHRQIEQWRFKREPTQLGIDSKSRLRTYNLDDPKQKAQAENFIGWNKRYEGYEGAKAIVAPLRDDVITWAVQTILVPKKYGVRRTANEIRLDSLEAPRWYQKAHPDWKKPKVRDILSAAEPKHRAWAETTSKPMAIANPPVFDSPEAMDMGIQYGDKTGPNPDGKASNTKWHNQTLDGKPKPSSLSDIPLEALAWKKGGFLSEIGMHSKTHEDGTHTVGFVEKFADDPRPYIVSLKIDGDSSLAHFDGKQTVIWNKRGRWRRDFHITDQITTSLKKKGVKSAKIMGELYAVGDGGETLPLNEISSIIVSPKTIDRQKQIRFAGFDIVELDGEDLSKAPYEDRVSKVDGLFEGGEIMTVPFFHSKGGMKEVQKAWDKGMKHPNFEGLVLRFEGMAKSHKIKMKGTADLAVIGFYRGKSPGRLENSVGGAMLAWMLPNGDFVYAGKSVIGKSDKEKEKMVSDLLKAKVEAPLFKIGGRTVDSSKTHLNGKGTFTMVKPWRVSEHDYRSINWGMKPVFRFSKGKVKIVGEMKAPTMFQPSFKRWRDDKSINGHDLRMEQVPVEGTGKWGQIDA